MPLLFLGPIGLPELLLIGALVLVIFGAKRLPQLGAGLGQGIRNFKESLTGKDEEKQLDPPPEENEQTR